MRSDNVRELLKYLRSKEQIGLIDVIRTRADSVARARGMFERGLINHRTCLVMLRDNSGIILYGVGRKMWHKALKPEVLRIHPECKTDARKQLHGYVDVYINLNP